MKHIPLEAHDATVQQFVLTLAQEEKETVLELNGQPVAWVVPVPPNHDAADLPWTEAKNARRCALIDREIEGTLTPAETVELRGLQDEMLRHRRRVAPLPLADARALQQQLLAPESTS